MEMHGLGLSRVLSGFLVRPHDQPFYGLLRPIRLG